MAEDPDRPRRICEGSQDIAKFCDAQQQYYARLAGDYGYTKDRFRDLATCYKDVPDHPEFAGVEQNVNTFKEYLRSSPPSLSFSLTAFGVSSTASSTAMLVVSGAQSATRVVTSPPPPPHWPASHSEDCAKRLEKLDPELGKLARSVWETFYSGVEDAPRSSLEHMRQLLDLLFRKLAPDDEVRQSKFFKTKSGEKPQQVHRGERLSYAASKHVADQSMRDLLLGQARQISVLYKKLNKLHGTDPPRKVAEEILTEAQAVLEQWVRVLGL